MRAAMGDAGYAAVTTQKRKVGAQQRKLSCTFCCMHRWRYCAFFIFGCSVHAGWHFSLRLRPFNPRWPIISSLSFKGSHSAPLIYPHLPLMSFKRREIVALCNKLCCQSVLLKLHWLCGKQKINDLLAGWGERVCVCLTKKERDWGMRVLVCTRTHAALPFSRPLSLRLPLSLSHVLYLSSFIQMEMRFTSFFPHCKWQGQQQMIQLA